MKRKHLCLWEGFLWDATVSVCTHVNGGVPIVVCWWGCLSGISLGEIHFDIRQSGPRAGSSQSSTATQRLPENGMKTRLQRGAGEHHGTIQLVFMGEIFFIMRSLENNHFLKANSMNADLFLRMYMYLSGWI